MTALRAFVRRHPFGFCVALAAVLAAFLLARHVVLRQRVTYTTAIAGEIGLLAATLLLVALLGWWRAAGVTAPVRWGWTLAVLAAAVAYYLTLDAAAFFVYRLVAAGLLLAALVGTAEEILCRGIVLESLRRFGPLAAAAGSAMFFGVLHLNNLALSPTPAVVAQAVYAILLGLFLAAVRLRVLSIWPCAIAHAAIDLPGLLTGHFVPPAASNPWLPLIAVGVALPWGAAGIAMLLWDELHTAPRPALP